MIGLAGCIRSRSNGALVLCVLGVGRALIHSCHTTPCMPSIPCHAGALRRGGFSPSRMEASDWGGGGAAREVAFPTPPCNTHIHRPARDHTILVWAQCNEGDRDAVVRLWQVISRKALDNGHQLEVTAFSPASRLPPPNLTSPYQLETERNK